MPGTLFIVATPIGNLEDITLRALRVLREAHVIAAEDTRRTARLLSHHGIVTRTISYHEHNTRTRTPQLMAMLRSGERIALVTDAGTPGVSDPGVELVRTCVEEGIEVDPVPGVSASLAAAVASGFPLFPLTILGFPPSRSSDRTRWMSSLAAIEHTLTFFEAPHRIERTLASMSPFLGTRPIVVARELTKVHQQFLRGSTDSVAQQLGTPRGEFTVVIGPVPEAEETAGASDAEVILEFGRTIELPNSTRRKAITEVARRCGRSARDVYATLERHKNSLE